MHNGFQMPMAAPPLMNQPPQIFGSYDHGLPMHQLPPELTAQMFADHSLLDDSNEAKRRRIARVSALLVWGKPFRGADVCGIFRLVTCAERRRSNATVNCPLARIASTTRPTASSRKWRRRGTHQKGASYHRLDGIVGVCGLQFFVYRAKYIEGLENRLGRMESLLRLSGMTWPLN